MYSEQYLEEALERTTELKRKNVEDYSLSMAKKTRIGRKPRSAKKTDAAKQDAITFSSLLDKFAQDKQMELPIYINDGSNTTVMVNGNQFSSMISSNEKINSQQDAARRALDTLIGIPMPSSDDAGELKPKDSGEDDTSSMEKHLPGKLNEITFKTLLDKFAQMKHLALPTYDNVKVDNCFLSTVTFDGIQFKALISYRRRHKAEDHAAKVALNAVMGDTPLPCDEQLISIGEAGSKDKDVGEDHLSSSTKEIHCRYPDPISYQNLLNKFAEQENLPLPTYDTVTVNNINLSTVTVNGNQFKGTYSTKKLYKAQTCAAQVALYALLGIPLTPDDRPLEPTCNLSLTSGNHPIETSETELKQKDGGEDSSSSMTKKHSSVKAINFKDLLNRFAEKEHLPVPTYNTVKISPTRGYISTVTINGKHFAAIHSNQQIIPTEVNAAQIALNALIVIPPTSDKQPVATSESEVKHVDDGEDASSMGKQILSEKKEPITYMTLLNKFAQRKHLPLPIYSSVTVKDNRFHTTVTFNGNQYTSSCKHYKNQRKEERRAARIALSAVTGTPQTSDTPVKDIIAYKGLLDKITQKEYLSLPTYQTVVINGCFFCTVTVNGNKFKAEKIFKDVTDAETSAAQIALDALIGIPSTSKEQSTSVGEADRSREDK